MKSFEAIHLMLVDDHAGTRKMLRSMLRQLGIVKVQEFESGAAALKKLGKDLPDLIICDIEMEPVNGIEFLNVIRSHPRLQKERIPLIFLTSHHEAEIVRKAKEAGANGFLIKPPSVSSLKERINAVLTS